MEESLREARYVAASLAGWVPPPVQRRRVVPIVALQ